MESEIFVVHSMGQKWTGLEHASEVILHLKSVIIVTRAGRGDGGCHPEITRDVVRECCT